MHGKQNCVMDRACWISWYDLPDAGRDDYLAWAHAVYIPKVRQRSGVLWAAHYASEANVIPLGGGKGRVGHVQADALVPTGDRYIMMFGGTGAHVFANPSPREFHASLPQTDRDMLALRRGERVNIMIEEARVDGLEADQPAKMDPSPCIQLGSFNAGSPEEEEELAAWYARWRLPSLQTLPGCVRVKKLVSVAGWAKHACCYEFTSLAARNEHFIHYERATPDMEAWSKQVVRNTVHAPGSANVARRIWPK